jgi:hypothetical protein
MPLVEQFSEEWISKYHQSWEEFRDKNCEDMDDEDCAELWQKSEESSFIAEFLVDVEELLFDSGSENVANELHSAIKKAANEHAYEDLMRDVGYLIDILEGDYVDSNNPFVHEELSLSLKNLTIQYPQEFTNEQLQLIQEF